MHQTRSKEVKMNGKIGKLKTKNGTVNKITNYFPLRRSGRRTAIEIQLERNDRIRQLIETGYNEGFLRIYECELKGRGIKAGRPFEKDEFVVEYKGDTVPYAEAKERERNYAKDSDIGSYMYFFEYQNKRWCVDATKETKFKGRLVNHSYLKPNLKSKVIQLPNSIHLCLFAKRNIQIGEELLYDYGDRRNNAIAYNPWLKCS